MDRSEGASGNHRAAFYGRWLARVTGAVFLAFVVNVLLGKLRDDFGWTFVWSLGKTGEFLLLLLTAVLLIVAALFQEIAKAPNDGIRNTKKQDHRSEP